MHNEDALKDENKDIKKKNANNSKQKEVAEVTGDGCKKIEENCSIDVSVNSEVNSIESFICNAVKD